MKLWYRITDLGDGSHRVNLYKTRDEAYEGLDEEGFSPHNDVPCEIDEAEIDLGEVND